MSNNEFLKSKKDRTEHMRKVKRKSFLEKAEKNYCIATNVTRSASLSLYVCGPEVVSL